MRTRATGLGFAFAAAMVSGVSIFANGYAVKHFTSPTVFTTAKNAVAGLLLLALLVRPARAGVAPPAVGRPVRWAALAALAVVGGSVPFVLFFEGLARAQATQAAFIQKTLVVWVALLAVPLLRERVRAPHVCAIALLVAGQAWLAGHAGTVVFGTGEAMILAATLLWAVEVVYVKRIVRWFPADTLAAARMALGAVLLVCWVAARGDLGQLGSFDAVQWKWVALSGLLLTAYVGAWYAALQRAHAVDVTAVLVFGAVVTALLSAFADGVSVSLPGTALVAAGTALVGALALRQRGVVEQTVT
jgi:drug/metabolite transporter (DMT)-like permease